MVTEREPAFPQKYKKSDLVFSLPKRRNPLLTHESIPDDYFGDHTIYRGDNRFFEDVTVTNNPKNTTATLPYDTICNWYQVPPVPEAYQKTGEIWVARRKQLVAVYTPIEETDDPQRKIVLARQNEKPEEIEEVATGVDMVTWLCDTQPFDPYDLTYLTGGTRQHIKPNIVDKAFAFAADISAQREQLPDRFPQRIIRAVVFEGSNR